MEFTKWVDEQSKAVKLILFFPIWGWIFGFIYRILKFVETSETATLIGAILFIIPFTGFILEIVDFIFIIIEGNLKILIPGGEKFGITGTVNTETKDEEKKDAKDEAITIEPNEEKKDETKSE